MKVNRDDVLALIETAPGITRAQLSATLNLGRNSLNKHLAKLLNEGRAHVEMEDGERHWFAGPKPAPAMQRFASVFDYAPRMALEAA